MTLSYKMVLAEAFQELNGWQDPPTLDKLAERSWHVLQRHRNLRVDLPDKFRDTSAPSSNDWVGYWHGNPVKAWIGENQKNAGKVFFSLIDNRFRAKVNVDTSHLETFQRLLQKSLIIDLLHMKADLCHKGKSLIFLPSHTRAPNYRSFPTSRSPADI